MSKDSATLRERAAGGNAERVSVSASGRRLRGDGSSGGRLRVDVRGEVSRGVKVKGPVIKGQVCRDEGSREGGRFPLFTPGFYLKGTL